MPGQPGSFAAYLEYTQRIRNVPALARMHSRQAETPLGILGLLSRQPKGIGIGHLADISDLSAANFYRTLKASSEAGLLQVEGAPLEETITITAKGRELANLAPISK